jgi:hypothetical protein
VHPDLSGEPKTSTSVVLRSDGRRRAIPDGCVRLARGDCVHRRKIARSDSDPTRVGIYAIESQARPVVPCAGPSAPRRDACRAVRKPWLYRSTSVSTSSVWRTIQAELTRSLHRRASAQPANSRASASRTGMTRSWRARRPLQAGVHVQPGTLIAPLLRPEDSEAHNTIMGSLAKMLPASHWGIEVASP